MELLDLVKEQRSHRTAQSQQTTEIARYLHELNSWIGSFTAASSKNLNDVSSKIDQLTDMVAPTLPDTSTPLLGTDGHGHGSTGTGAHGVVGMLEDVKGMVAQLMRERGQRDGEGEAAAAAAARGRMEGALAGLEAKLGHQHSCESDRVLSSFCSATSRADHCCCFCPCAF